MNKMLAMLIGLIITDGSIYYDKSKKTYCIQFTNKSKKLRDVFKILMENCFGINKFYEIECKNAISIRVFSKKIANELFNYSPTYRTLPCKSNPKCNKFSCVTCSPFTYAERNYPPTLIHDSILSKNVFSKSFLRGFASGDGSQYVNTKHSIYTIELTCYHPYLKKQLMSCLKQLNFYPRQKENAVLVSGIDQFTRFMDEIGMVK